MGANSTKTSGAAHRRCLGEYSRWTSNLVGHGTQVFETMASTKKDNPNVVVSFKGSCHENMLELDRFLLQVRQSFHSRYLMKFRVQSELPTSMPVIQS